MIRQVTINCAERGLILLRVRDEIRLTILSYQSLLESAVAYGIRKAILSEGQQSQAVLERDEEVEKNKDLGASIEQLQKELAHERLSKAEEVRILEQTMKEENERLLESNKVLKVGLGQYSSPRTRSRIYSPVRCTSKRYSKWTSNYNSSKAH
jgi:dynein light intermediate chain, axonemal